MLDLDIHIAGLDLWMLVDLVEAFPVALVGGSDGNPAVSCGEYLVGGRQAMCCSEALGRGTCRPIFVGLPDSVCHCCLEEGGIDVLALACTGAGEEGGQDGMAGEQASIEVADRYSYLGGL